LKNYKANLKERRSKVRKLLAKGLTAGEIASQFGVTTRTIYNDTKSISKEIAKELGKMNWMAEMKKSWDIFDLGLKRLERLYIKLLKKEEQGEDVTKDLFSVVDRIIKIANEKIKAMQAFGILPREQITINQN